ncbi:MULTISPECIES: hypothetical protein [unclassified Streptomyces]|uniref:hypothetical protein n=1 Tax=unclassified Streptomyces TaxID=2593676 RepID=UPI0035E2C811
MPHRREADRVVHGFPHRAVVGASLTALHRRLSPDGIRRYPVSVPASETAIGDDEDLRLGTRRVARALVRHLGLPDARMVVDFRPMEHAGAVELTPGPEYSVEVHERFRTRRRDIGAVLAHEIAHVLLHRLGLSFPRTAENEILTDVTAAYLGAGWLLLDAYREDGVERQRLGYLTPEEFGYVLAKRAEVFGEDPSPWFTSPVAYDAWVRGRAEARRERTAPPLAGAGPVERRRYAWERRRGRAGGDAPYAFDGGAPATGVSFPCPVCRQRLRIPAGRTLRARCGVCGTVLECAS